jgi:hypothetical protein
MASTYSTNLAIELIGTGDQAGAWGNTTNTNLGTLIEQAISGYVTQAVVTGTDTVITIPNGATGVARNMYIELTGTGGTNTNLIVPTNKKLYFIYNNTSSGQVTVKVAGQTGVSVPNGEKMVLVSDGTDIVNALTYIADLGTNSLTVNNILATSASITTLTGGSSNITTLSGTTLGFTSGTLTNLNVTSLTVSSLSLSNATLASASITTLTATSGTVTTLKSTSATIDNLSSTSANISTLTGTNFSATSLTLTNALRIAEGGTGLDSTPTNGQLLIGNGTGFNLNTLTGGPGVGITNQSGAITITATGTGFIASVSATSPLQSTGTQSIVISIASSTGSGAVVLADNPTMSSATVTNLASTSANITTLTGTTFGTTATTQLRGASGQITTLTATSANITTLTGTTATYTSATLTNLNSTSANVTTLTGTNFSATSLTLTNALRVSQGGTALSSTPTNGQLLIGNGTGYTLATLTAGSGITITNNAGSISISAAGLPIVTVTASTAISASAGLHYILTAGSAATVTLPASPTISDTIYVTVANSLTTNVIARNGKPIQGIAEDMTLNAPYASAQLRFTDNTEGWILA